MKNSTDTGSVLLVDSEEENVNLMVRSLRGQAQLLTADCAEVARRHLATHPVDVIVSDCRLPGESGLDLLRDVSVTSPAIGRVLVTAYGETPEVVQACKEGLLQRFLVKPFVIGHLRATVQQMLRVARCGPPARLVLLTEQETLVEEITAAVAGRNIRCNSVSSTKALLTAVSNDEAHVVVIDIRCAKIDALHCLERLRLKDPDLPVLVYTNDASAGLSFLAAGALDVLSPPLNSEHACIRIERSIEWRISNVERRQLATEVQARRRTDETVAESAAMRGVFDRARLVAPHGIPVLISGETGTGKEVVARYVHAHSHRRNSPFVAINCGALTENLLESELFGHEAGAFTGAARGKVGLLEAANGGTVFLDEIGELPLSAQVRLLRYLENSEVRRVGSTHAKTVDVRVIAATHCDLQQMVATQTFRHDLFYRLNGVTLHVPPLQDRREDILPLMLLARARCCARADAPLADFGAAAIQEAEAHDWPGNVRELFHTVERTLVLSSSNIIQSLELSRNGPTKSPAKTQGGALDIKVDTSQPIRESVGFVMEDLERRYLRCVLAQYGGNVGKAAEHAGLHRKSLYNKMKRYGLG